MTSSERQAQTRKLGRVEVIQVQLRELQAELAHLRRFPADDFANGTVLQVVKTYKRPLLTGTIIQLNSLVGQTVKWSPDSGEVVEQQYTYVLLKAGGQWWCTGQNGHQINGASWDKVIEFVGDDELIDVRTGLSVMTDSEDVAGSPEQNPGYDIVTPNAPTLVDVLGEEQAAKVEEFLANPETGVKMERPRPRERSEFLNPRVREQEV